MALQPIPQEFAFPPEFNPGEGDVLVMNQDILEYSGWIAGYVNDIRRRLNYLLVRYNSSIRRETDAMQKKLSLMREGPNGILHMIQEVIDMGGIPVLLPAVLEEAINQLLGPPKLVDAGAALAADAGGAAALAAAVGGAAALAGGGAAALAAAGGGGAAALAAAGGGGAALAAAAHGDPAAPAIGVRAVPAPVEEVLHD